MVVARFVYAFCLILVLTTMGLGCTTFGVTKSASADGSIFIGHTNDGFSLGDIGGTIKEDMVSFRYIPAQNYTPGSLRPIIYDPNSGAKLANKGISYQGNKTQDFDTIIGYIDQVEHTYGYLTGVYGIINEYQLMSAECTDYSKIFPDAEEGKRIFYSSELSNIAMERCKTAKEAVNLTGRLIDDFGYYGSGETLIFADTEEVWVIEMCGGTPSGSGGYWVAQRVPDGEVFVAANEFRIREIDPKNEDQLFSWNLFSDAENMGWYDPAEGPLDWAAIFGAGEFLNPYYSLQRVWRIMDRIAPTRKLSPYVDGPFTREYPFSIAPDEKIDIRDAFDLFRDHYEGSVFDLAKPPGGGAFADPYRVWGPLEDDDHPSHGEVKPGAWSRPISTDQCGYSYVAQARDWLPDAIGGICWLGLSSPSETCYAPFYAGIYDIPAPYKDGSHWDFDMNTAFWPFEIVQNWARLMYSEMMPIIRAEQVRLEGAVLSRQTDIEAQALKLLEKDERSARAFLTQYTNSTAIENLDSWKKLFEILVVTCRNGQYNDIRNKTITNIGYPDWWLDNASYQYGPRVYDLKSLREIPNVRYTGRTEYLASADAIGYIQQHQLKNSRHLVKPARSIAIQ
ncbi:MAG: Peptidase family C69 [Methanosaeta sp. PtaU1.Bin112]|nr:MAG: Peptidase family C69 [Methanosaeta sp. PtaU1.Bin112]